MRNLYLRSILIFAICVSPLTFAVSTDLRNSYAVVWTVITNDTALYNDLMADQSAELLKLWKEGMIENVYLDNKDTSNVVSIGGKAKVIFFIKAETVTAAENILNTMPFVKARVAMYSLFPVGILWLKQY